MPLVACLLVKFHFALGWLASSVLGQLSSGSSWNLRPWGREGAVYLAPLCLAMTRIPPSHLLIFRHVSRFPTLLEYVSIFLSFLLPSSQHCMWSRPSTQGAPLLHFNKVDLTYFKASRSGFHAMNQILHYVILRASPVILGSASMNGKWLPSRTQMHTQGKLPLIMHSLLLDFWEIVNKNWLLLKSNR